jgi:putative protease
VVSCYREALAACQDQTFTEDKIKSWDQRLARVFNRGFWDGYYLGQRLGEWSHRYGSSATTRKIRTGRGINYFSKSGVAEFQIESGELNTGDEILITGPTTGVIESRVEEIRVDNRPVEKAIKGQRISIPLTTKIRPSDTLFKIVQFKPDKAK